MRCLFALALLLPLAAAAQPTAAQPGARLAVEPTTFTADDGRTVPAEVGRFRVPENRGRAGGRTIELAFVRFPSTSPTPGPPIVYLAGGPGGAGTDAAKGTRFDLFQALRSVADVIAFDQRGTGLSERVPDCPYRTAVPLGEPADQATQAAAMAETTRACAEHWRRLGVDLAAYNTQESADDLDALRQALGASQIQLWAISYGTHLALATIRRHPETVARAVLAGVEGPDHTLKLPSDQQALLERIAAAHAADHPDASPFLDDVAAVLDRLRESPVVVDVESRGETVPLAITAFDVQALAANMLGGPETSMQLPSMFAAMRAGDFSAVAPWIVWTKGPRGVDAMSAAMDAASGASLLRRARIAREARRTLLGDAINFPGPEQAAALGVPDLGPGFRAPVVSDVPVLLISGTMDGRTPVGNADEVDAGLSNSAHLVIEGAGHSDPLFLGSPLILDRMRAFFDGEPVTDEMLSLTSGEPLAATPAGTPTPASSRPLVPGDGRLDLAAVPEPSEQTFLLTIVQGAQRQPFGTLTETLTRTTDGGGVRVQRIDSPRGSQVDSLTFAADLSPRSHASRNPGRTVRLRFTPDAVSGTYTDAGAEPVAIDDARSGPSFDSGLVDLVARAVPLDAGFEVQARTYERASAGAAETEVSYTVRVARWEVLDGRDTAVVEYAKDGGPTTRSWVDVETRAVLRLESEVAPGVLLRMEPSADR